MFINQINPTTTNLMSFKAVDAKMLERNKTKILMTVASDIYAPKLKIKKPETLVEKEVLLEILEKRKFLDKLIRLTNERFRTSVIIDEYNELVEKNPHSEECQNLKEEIDKKGDLKKYYETVDKQIAIERKKHENSLNYFAEIDQLEDEYLEHKKIKPIHIEKFAIQADKNNLNPNKEFSTRELIEIVKNIEIGATKEVKKPLSRKEVLAEARKLYEQKLQETVDIYSDDYNYYKISQGARNFVEKTFASNIAKISGIKKDLSQIYNEIEEKYTKNVYKIKGIPYQDVGAFWNMLKEIEESIFECVSEIDSLKIDLKTNKNNEELNTKLKEKEDFLQELKETWIFYMQNSVAAENENQKIMEKAGVLKEYNYLVERNKNLNKYASLFKVYKENNDSIPKELWKEIIS